MARWHLRFSARSKLLSSSFLLLLGLLIICVTLGLAWLLSLRRARRGYEARLRQLTERERVATGLHDTLLQSMQGMILRFQSVSHRLAADHPERATIETILDQADEVLAEGRHQILALRMPVVYGDNLSQAFAAIGQALQESFDIPFRMIVSGRAEPLTGDSGGEIYSIAREALYHAFQHAQAGQIELELHYGCEFFEVQVRDDGQAESPRPLCSMRERAARLSATLELLNLPERGTAVLLKVPGSVCYQTPHPLGWQHRLAAWFGSICH